MTKKNSSSSRSSVSRPRRAVLMGLLIVGVVVSGALAMDERDGGQISARTWNHRQLPRGCQGIDFVSTLMNRCDCSQRLQLPKDKEDGEKASHSHPRSFANDVLDHVARFSFSLFCFLASFCGSIVAIEALFHSTGGNDCKHTATMRKARPYSPTLVKLRLDLERSFRQGETRISCLANQYLNAAEVAEVLLPVVKEGRARGWKSLDLSGNEVTDAGLEKIFEAMQETGSLALEELSLKRCGLRRIAPSLIEFLRVSHSSIKELHLGNNTLDDRSIAVLARNLPFTSLVDLNLSGNDLTDASLQVFCEATHNLTTRLRCLHLRGNRITDNGISFLVSSVLFRDVQLLDLSANAITDQGIATLASSLTSSLPNTSLVELSLSDNALITDRGIALLVEAIVAGNVRVSRLLMDNMRQITTQGVNAVKSQYVRRSPFARLVSMAGNEQIPSKDLDELQRMMKRSRSSWFRSSLYLLATKDVKRIARASLVNPSPFSMLNKDILRLIVEALMNDH